MNKKELKEKLDNCEWDKIKMTFIFLITIVVFIFITLNPPEPLSNINADNLTSNNYYCYRVCDHMICENKTNSSDYYSCNLDGSYCVRGDW